MRLVGHLSFIIWTFAFAAFAAAGVAPTVYDTAAIPNAAAAAVEKMSASNAALAELQEAKVAVQAAIDNYNAARDRFITAQQAAQSEILQVIQVSDGVYQAHAEDSAPPKIEVPEFNPTPEPEPEPPVDPQPADPFVPPLEAQPFRGR